MTFMRKVDLQHLCPTTVFLTAAKADAESWQDESWQDERATAAARLLRSHDSGGRGSWSVPGEERCGTDSCLVFGGQHEQRSSCYEISSGATSQNS